MILFIFEGKSREPSLFYTLQKLFFQNTNEHIVCSFGNNLYQLYKELKKYEGNGDIVSILKDKYKDKINSPFAGNELSSDFSEIYLFFDYDFQNTNIQIETINSQVSEMLEIFDDETNFGKLYINYPMVESIRYTRELPDKQYYKYTISREYCHNFKSLSAEFSHYKSLDFIVLDQRKTVYDDEIKHIQSNWKFLKEQNVNKANYICTGNYCTPITKSVISQKIYLTIKY